MCKYFISVFIPQIFKRCGISKQALREITVGIPYNSAQELSVMNVINEVLFADKAPEDFTAEVSA